MKKTKKFAVIVDGNNFAWRSISAIPTPIINPETGVDVTGPWNATRMLTKIIESWQPDACFIVWDTAVPSTKKEVLPTYKAFRVDEAREAFMERMITRVKAGIPMIKELATHAGFVNVEIPDAEADDVIAGLVYDEEMMQDYIPVVISTDRDYLHLADRAYVVIAKRGEVIANTKTFPEATSLIYKLPNELQYPWTGHLLFQSLTGDSGDDVPGYKGIKERYAARIVNTIQNSIGSDCLRNLELVKKAFEETPLQNIPGIIRKPFQQVALDMKLLEFNWSFFDPHTWIERYVKDGLASLDFALEDPKETFSSFATKITILDSPIYHDCFDRQREQTKNTIEKNMLCQK